jgi:hypothetical protein
MYTHCRQFPHLVGRSDGDIRSLVRNGMAKRPHLIRIMRVRNIAVLLCMIAIAAVLVWVRPFDPDSTATLTGATLIISGGVGTVLLLIWNLIWVNTVLWKLTLEETKERG